jgi:serine phosphatase RsbU (regulator of sigma subunit)
MHSAAMSLRSLLTVWYAEVVTALQNQLVGHAAPLLLVSTAGPMSIRHLIDSRNRTSIGRLDSNSLQLDHPEVSRQHVELYVEGGQWFLRDVGSKHGTRVNGVVVPRGQSAPLRVDDQIEISPWTFRLIEPAADMTVIEQVRLQRDELPPGSSVKPLTGAATQELDRHRLRLLLSCVGAIQAADDEQSLAEAVLDALVSGTGYPNAAVLKPTADDQSVQIIAKRGSVTGDDGQPLLSRSLIREACEGRPAQLLTNDEAINEAHSIVQLGITQAICVPIMIESSVARLLYLDRRQGAGRAGLSAAPRDVTSLGDRVRDDERRGTAGPFAAGVANLASMALASLMRRDLKQRLMRVELELAVAAEIQQGVLPAREGEFGSIRYRGASRPGQQLSGDFFDVIEVAGGRVAVTLGDVTGKGVAASVLMTTAHGFLHAALLQHGDGLRAVRELNSYLRARSASGRFITLWLGVFDAAASTLRFVNAGHGYAWLASRDGAIAHLSGGGGLPVGVESPLQYESSEVSFGPGDRVVLVSDGIIEQPSMNAAAGQRDEFGRDLLQRWLREPHHGDDIERLFHAVTVHAGSQRLTDDATVLIVSR